MSKDSSENRTLVVDSAIIENLCELHTALDAVEELPRALSLKEIESIGIQASLSAGVNELSEGRKREIDAISHLGLVAIAFDDLVTTNNAKNTLWNRGLNGKIGAVMLWFDLRKVKKNIISDILKEK
jgi:hypothetical protein